MASVSPLPFRNRRPPDEPPAFVPAVSIEPEPFDPRRLLGALRRRKYLIGGIMLLGAGLGMLWANQIVPLYSAQVTLVIEGKRQNIVNIESVAQGLTPDFYTNETQAAVIASRENVGRVVDRLNLYEHRLFDPSRAPPSAGLLDVVRAAARGWLGGEAEEAREAFDPFAGMTPEERRAARREHLIDAFLGGLSVIPSQRARLVTVSYSSHDPVFAAEAANATAEAYLREQLDSRGSVTQRASQWLSQRAGELRDRLIESETRLEEFRRKAGISESEGGSNVLRDQIAKMNADLVASRARRTEAEARYQQIQTLLTASGGTETAAAVLDSPLIQRLREQETVVLRKIAELRTQLRGQHPRLILAENELKDLRDKISNEVGKIVTSLGNELEIAQVRERNLQAELNRLERAMEEQNQAAVSLRALQTEVQANRQLYETVIARFKETDVVDDGLQEADARIISRATVPGMPYYPQKRMMVIVALFFATMIGVGIAILLELLDSGFRTAAQLEDMTGLPAIGGIPRLKRADRRKSPHQVVVQRPNSAYGEAIRSVRTALMLSGIEEAPRTVLITSSVSGEGKTSLSLSLAALAAHSGQRAIVIDCDMRHPSVHEALGTDNEAGLSDYLAGHAELGDVIDIDPDTGLHFILAGSRVPHPAELLGSNQMRALLHRLSGMYELVVLDLPPLLAVSDALVLARVVDRAIYVVRWETTKRETAVAGIKQLVDAGANMAGVVLSQIDIRKQHRYGYQGAGGYYYGHNPKYYSE